MVVILTFGGTNRLLLLVTTITILPILAVVERLRVEESLPLACVTILWLQLQVLTVVDLTLRAIRERLREIEGAEAGDDLLGRSRDVHQTDGAV